MILVLKLLNSRTWMTPQSSIVIFQALETSAASLTSVSSASSLASTASTASTAFISQKTSWSWLFDHPCHQNDQRRSLVMEWILKSKFSLIFGTLSVGGYWGQSFLFFWILVDETVLRSKADNFESQTVYFWYIKAMSKSIDKFEYYHTLLCTLSGRHSVWRGMCLH